MEKAQVFLDVQIPAVQVCQDSAICPHLLLHYPDKAGRGDPGIFPERALGFHKDM